MKLQMHTDKHRYLFSWFLQGELRRGGLSLRGRVRPAGLSVSICVHLWLIACMIPVSSYAEETITVAVASSLYPTMQQQVIQFEQEHDVQVRLISGSTGRLYNQIIQGAPFDLFIAADEIRPAKLIEQGKALEQYHTGQAYLGVKYGKRILADLRQLRAASVQRIAIANPDVAPFGQSAKEVLQQRGLWKTLKPKFVYTQNAMQATMMVDQGLVDAAFVPIALPEHAIAVIYYRAVVLTEKAVALRLLKHVQAGYEIAASPVSAKR